jgi:transposase
MLFFGIQLPARCGGGTAPYLSINCIGWTAEAMLRFLLVEAAQVTARSIPEWRSKYFHLMMRRGRKVAMARKLAIRLYWMWRKGWDYEQVKKFGSHVGQFGTGRGVQ